MPAQYLAALSIDDRTEQWERSLPKESAKRKRTLVAESDGAVVAAATIGPDPDDLSTGSLLLMYAVEPAWGSGAGRALMHASREALIDLGFERAILWVLEKNDRARRFYERDGWRPDGKSHVDDYGGAGLVALRYVTNLSDDRLPSA
jgi:GNAT superfamily N-acetyltransferase